jgi:hypothetical protein
MFHRFVAHDKKDDKRRQKDYNVGEDDSDDNEGTCETAAF